MDPQKTIITAINTAGFLRNSTGKAFFTDLFWIIGKLAGVQLSAKPSGRAIAWTDTDFETSVINRVCQCVSFQTGVDDHGALYTTPDVTVISGENGPVIAIVELVGAAFTVGENCQLGVGTCGALTRNRPRLQSVLGILVNFDGTARIYLSKPEDTYLHLLQINKTPFYLHDSESFEKFLTVLVVTIKNIYEGRD